MGEGGAAVHPGGPQNLLHPAGQGGADDSQTSETRVPVLDPCRREEHRGRPHRHAYQRDPQLQHPAGGEDRADPHQHPPPDQSVGVSQGQPQSQHSQLLHPAEEPRSDGPAEPEHSGASDLTVTSTLTAECHTTSACLYTFIYDYVLLPLSSLVAYKVRCLVQNKM